MLFCLVGVWLLAFPLLGNEKTIVPISEIVRKLDKNNLEIIVGWDRVEGIRESLDNSTALQDAIKAMDLSKIAEIINASTDYQLIVGKDYVSIIPKINPSHYTTPISRLELKNNSAKNIAVGEFIQKIEPVENLIYLIHLSSLPTQAGGIAFRKISLPEGKAQGYEILNSIARQSGAKSWNITYAIVTHSSDGFKAVVSSPVRLISGIVDFN